MDKLQEKTHEHHAEHKHHDSHEHHAEHGHTHQKHHQPHDEHKYHEHHETHRHKKDKLLTKQMMALMAIAVLLVLFNQVQINAVSTTLGTGFVTQSHSSSTSMLSGGGDLSSVDVDGLQSTAQTVAAVFDLEGASGDEVMQIMFPTGTPEYGEELDVSYDDPVASLTVLAGMYRGLKTEVEKSDPEAFARFVNLASNPKGVSCEYCCGVGPVGVDKTGNSKCGCKHNPALLSVSLYLAAYSDYTDAEILRETMKWKTLFFPKNMIELGASIAGGDSSVLENLPGMVGGC